MSTSGLVVEYISAIDVTRARFPADACSHSWLLALQLALATLLQLLRRLPCLSYVCGSNCAKQDKVTADKAAWDCCLAESMPRPRLWHIPQRPKQCTATSCRHALPGGGGWM